MSKKTTKRALAMSFVSVFLCVCMLVGTTFAWFTDSVTSTNNTIKSGNLDVDLHYWDNSMATGSTISLAEHPDTLLFKNVKGEAILWEPGASGFGQFEVANEGSLALKYELTLAFSNATETPDGKTLADVLTVYAIARGGNTGGDATMGDPNLETLRTTRIDTLMDGYNDVALKDFVLKGYLLPGESFTYELGVSWDPSANDNDYNVANGLSMDFGATLVATQMTYEEDAYNDQYDKDATYPVIISSSADLGSAIASGKPFQLGADVTYASPISNDTTIDLNGKTFEATNTIKLSNNADLTMTGGDYEVNSTYGHVDVRPNTAEGSTVVFEDVDFSYNKKGPSYGPSTNRLGSVVEVCAEVADAKSVVVFKNCTFDNAQVVIEGMSGKTGVVDVTFENCTFNALTSSAPIYVQNYVTGTIKVVGCTFNLECTSSTASAISVSSSSSTAVTVTAENNTINATAATAYTYNPAAGETEVDNVKVNGTPANIKFISAYANTTVNETNTTKTGIAQ